MLDNLSNLFLCIFEFYKPSIINFHDTFPSEVSEDDFRSVYALTFRQMGTTQRRKILNVRSLRCLIIIPIMIYLTNLLNSQGARNNLNGSRFSSGNSSEIPVSKDWDSVVSNFLSTLSVDALKTKNIMVAHGKNRSHSNVLLTVRNGIVDINATGLQVQYINGRYASLQAMISTVVSEDQRLRMVNLTALVDVSDGGPPHVATFISARHWQALKNAIPVPLGNPRGGDSGTATPVLGWDDYANRHMKRHWKEYPWNRKIKKAVFRGALRMQRHALGTCNGGRLKKCRPARNWTEVNRGVLYQVTKKHSDIFDVGFTSTTPFPEYGPMQLQDAPPQAEYIPFLDLQRYKLIISVGSNQDWAERMRGLMFLNSVIVYHQAETKEFYTPLLKPWKHYVPCAVDMSDLVTNVRYALSQDVEINSILKNQISFANRYLSEIAMLEYWKVLLLKFSELQDKADQTIF